jgi:O-antigen/teichoic acid export membrane protein
MKAPVRPEDGVGVAAGRVSAGRNVGKMLAATAVTGATGVALTFWVPALLPVDEFGYWRSFLLYAGYAGFLHLGMVDGALLNWTKQRESRAGASSLRGSLVALTVQHLAIAALGLLLLTARFARRQHFSEILAALLAYALLFNLTGLVQAHLQARLRFSAVAAATAMPGAIFLLLLGVLRFGRVTLHVTLDGLMLAYLAAWAATLAVLLGLSMGDKQGKEGKGIMSWGASQRASGKHIGAGWAIMLANTSYGLMQSADRITVNLTRPIHDFAIYSLAQSSIYVPVAIIAAIARVAFSHFATATEAGREARYRDTTRLLTLAWMLLLPYYFAVEWAVVRWLGRYTPGLSAGKVLLLSVLFLSLISVVQANAAALAGAQRRFFAGSVAAVALALATAWLCSKGLGSKGMGWGWSGSLTAVAWSQVVSAGVWWLGNEWAARRERSARMVQRGSCSRTNAHLSDDRTVAKMGHPVVGTGEISRVILAFGAAAGGLYLATILSTQAPLRAVLYYGLEAIPISMLYGRQLRGMMPLLRDGFSRATGGR